MIQTYVVWLEKKKYSVLCDVNIIYTATYQIASPWNTTTFVAH